MSREVSPGCPGFKFLDEHGTLVPEKVYYRYHSFINAIINIREERARQEQRIKDVGNGRRRPFITVLPEPAKI